MCTLAWHMSNSSLLGFFGVTLSLSCALAVPLFAGCGSSSSGNTGGQGGGGSHVGGSHVGGGNVGGAANCDAFENETATPVPVRLVNHTNADIFVQANDDQHCGPLPFLIQDPQGNHLTWTNKGLCNPTCEDTMCVCTATCAAAPATRVTPQGSVTIQWKGVVREERTLAAGCLPAGGFCNPGATCEAEVVPKQFPLTFVGTAWTAADCGGNACTCTPDASGSCVIDHSDPSGEAVQATATFMAGGAGVDIVFEGN
jgi:hypothetical protein